MKIISLIFSLLLSQFVFALTEKVVVTGMDRPWAVVAAPTGDYWITEKFNGDIQIYNSKFELQKKLTGFPDLEGYVEGGLMDIAFHPKFKDNGWIYAAYSVPTSKGHATRIARFTYKDGKLVDYKLMLQGPGSEAGNHFGSRLLFDDSGYLLASFGDRSERDKAQDLTVLNGKIVRITDDGKIPSDNPFGGNNPVYTYGNRNPQGLAIHPQTRRIYDSEHGPSGYDGPGGGDELNEISKGKNYGWPTIHHQMKAANMETPIMENTPAIAPSGMAFYTGSAFPDWKNDLFIACLKGQQVLRVRIGNDGRIDKTETLLPNKYGRIRDIENGPNGSLLVLAEQGKLIQLTP